jgi:hypothetical protein
MIVQVHVEGPGRVDVLEADDCQRLHVDGGGASAVDVGSALAASGLGSVGPSGNAELDVDALLAAAESKSRGSDWRDRWLAMLEYAANKGWLSDDGHRLTAHIVGSAET